MKLQPAICIGTVALALLEIAFGQDFTNLDFELATIPHTAVGQWGGSVDPLLAFPGWTVSGFPTYTVYNNLTIGSPEVVLMGPDFPNGPGFLPLQGANSVLLGFLGVIGPPTLSQTGLIPAGTKSITFLVQDVRGVEGIQGAVLLVNGTNVPLYPISDGRLAGDVSTFAGTVAQITFTTRRELYHVIYFYFDDIQFSSSPIPALVYHLGASVAGMSQVTLSWSTNLIGYALESSDSPTSASWVGMTNAPVIDSSRFSVTVDAVFPQQFFRLHQQ